LVISDNIKEAIRFLSKGAIIAYPTEGVFGLGCDPFNKEAVLDLLKLKQRPVTKGLILLASDWEQVKNLVKPLTKDLLKKINTFQSPITWVFPASQNAPQWITGSHQSIAIRFTRFPLARSLCEYFRKPIVSTSANLFGQPPAKNVEAVINYFKDQIAFLLKGNVGDLDKPTPLRNILNDEILRE
jgi:L-threonylcarbamoyladenylate synthase